MFTLELDHVSKKSPDLAPPSLTRRVMDVFSPFSGSIAAIAAVLAVPVLLAAGYWLLVVNGPTPVVKARIDDSGMVARSGGISG